MSGFATGPLIKKEHLPVQMDFSYKFFVRCPLYPRRPTVKPKHLLLSINFQDGCSHLPVNKIKDLELIHFSYILDSDLLLRFFFNEELGRVANGTSGTGGSYLCYLVFASFRGSIIQCFSTLTT